MKQLHETYSFANKVMTAEERNYSPLEQAICALMFAMIRFRSYLLPTKFTIISVEDTFPYALQHASTSAKISKWVSRLQEFEFIVTIEHTTKASLADILTHRVFERKVRASKSPASEEKIAHLEDAYTLHFDGAFKRSLGKAMVGIVIINPLGNKVF